MRSRDSESVRAWREEWRQIEEKERLERERPLREAEEQLKKTARELGEFTRKIALTEPIDRYDETALTGVPRSDSDPGLVAALAAAKPWAANEPRYTRLSPGQRAEVGESLYQFIVRNRLDALRPESWKRAFEILYHVGAIPNPAEEPPDPEVVAEEPEPQSVTQAAPAEIEQGWDIVTGEPRTYRRREVDAMDSLTYRKTFRLCGDRRPVFVDPRV